MYLVSCVPAAFLSFSDSDDAAENVFVIAFHRIMAMDHTALSRPVLYYPRLITLLLNSKEQGSFIAFLAFRLIYLLIKSFLFGTFLFVDVVVAKAVHFQSHKHTRTIIVAFHGLYRGTIYCKHELTRPTRTTSDKSESSILIPWCVCLFLRRCVPQQFYCWRHFHHRTRIT